MRGKWGLFTGLAIVVITLVAVVLWLIFGQGGATDPPAATPLPTTAPSTPPPTSTPNPVDDIDEADPAEEPAPEEIEPSPAPKKSIVRQPSSKPVPSKPTPPPPTPTPATPPAALEVSLRTDTGASSADGITNDAHIVISGLQPGANWQYRVNGGSWLSGTGDGFNLPHGEYDNTVEVRQVQSGLFSDISVLPLVTIDLIAPEPVILSANLATAVTPAGHTLDGLINLGNLEPDASWRYSFDGVVFVDGNTQIGHLPLGASTITVTQTDIAGNTSEPATSTWNVSDTLNLADPDLTAAIIAALFDTYSGLHVDATHQSHITQGDAILNDLDGVVPAGISGQLMVGSEAIADIDTADLNGYFAPSSGLAIYATMVNTVIDRSGFLHRLEIRASVEGTTLIGGDGGNLLVGGNGNDILYGGAGDDELYGSNGINLFYPGFGQNFISFGGTTNTVVYSAAEIASKASPDRITGFIPGLDRIELEIPGLPTGPLTSFSDDRGSNIFTGNASGSAMPQVILTHWNGTTRDSSPYLWVDFDGSGPDSAYPLLSLGTASVVTAGDIWVR